MNFGIGFVFGGLLVALVLTHATETKKLWLSVEGAVSRKFAEKYRSIRMKF